MENQGERLAWKNWMYFALSIQSASGAIGLICAFVIRRSRVLIVVHCLMLVFALVGFMGYSINSNFMVLSHGFLTFTVSLALYVYQFVLIIAAQQNFWDIFLSVPLLVDMVIGYMSINYLNKLKKLNEESSEVPNFSANDLSENFLHSGICCCCQDREADMIVYNCGHRCLCCVCSAGFTKGTSRCPICRHVVIDLVKIYE